MVGSEDPGNVVFVGIGWCKVAKVGVLTYSSVENLLFLASLLKKIVSKQRKGIHASER